eukprot:11268691-Heterocapsa_arctica.AAC.1
MVSMSSLSSCLLGSNLFTVRAVKVPYSFVPMMNSSLSTLLPKKMPRSKLASAFCCRSPPGFLPLFECACRKST